MPDAKINPDNTLLIFDEVQEFREHLLLLRQYRTEK